MIRKLTTLDAAQVSILHIRSMPDDFLPTFGETFLCTLHQLLITSPYTSAWGTFVDNKLQGFIIGATHSQKLMRSIYIRGWTTFLPQIVNKIIINPKIIIFLIQTFFYTHKGNPPAELIIIAVDAKVRHKGVGKNLYHTLTTDFKKRRISEFTVGTHQKNSIANKFYKKLGGEYRYSFRLYRNKWNVYFFRI